MATRDLAYRFSLGFGYTHINTRHAINIYSTLFARKIVQHSIPTNTFPFLPKTPQPHILAYIKWLFYPHKTPNGFHQRGHMLKMRRRGVTRGSCIYGMRGVIYCSWGTRAKRALQWRIALSASVRSVCALSKREQLRFLCNWWVLCARW